MLRMQTGELSLGDDGGAIQAVTQELEGMVYGTPVNSATQLEPDSFVLGEEIYAHWMS